MTSESRRDKRNTRKRKETKSRMIAALLFGSVLTIMGVGCGAIIVKYAILGTQALNWPTTLGTITHSDVKWSTSASQSGRAHVKADLDIRYAYRVDEKMYQNDRVYFMPNRLPTKEWRRSKFEEFPKGAEVNVHYQPENPQNSVLEPGAQGKWLAFIGTFICFFIFLGVAALKGGISDLCALLKPQN